MIKCLISDCKKETVLNLCLLNHFLQSEEILFAIEKRNAEHRTSKKYVNLRINHSQKLYMLLTYISQEFNSVSTYCILRVFLGRLELGQSDGYTLHRVLVFSDTIP